MTAKELMGEVIAKLNKAGFIGGFYHYNKGECSCCYGLEDTLFQVNENTPENWGNYDSDSFLYKMTYKTSDEEKATKFRKSANKLVRKYFGKMADTAKSNFQAIIVHVN